jgi:prepilin-type processing-associated H-X9-DG protein
MPSPQRPRRALTLVEVLVIIAILALLLALLFPAIMRMRTYASQLEEIEQLRKLGRAWMLYAQTHQGKTVRQTNSDPPDGWIKRLSPYADNIDDYIVSPGDPNRQKRLRHNNQNPVHKTSSFVLNPYFSTDMKDPLNPAKVLSCEKISECKSLSTAIVLVPASTESGVPGVGHISPLAWFSGPPELAWKRTTSKIGIQPDRFLASSSVDQSLGSSNYLFADGHVESINAERIKTWIDQGKNFLIPEK